MKQLVSSFLILGCLIQSTAKADILMGCNIGSFSSNFWYTSASMLVDDEPVVLGATHIRAGNEQYGDAYKNSIWIESLFLETYSSEAAISIDASGNPHLMNAGPVTKISQATKYHPPGEGLTWNFLEVDAEAWGKISGTWTYDSSFDKRCIAYLSTE